MENNNKEKLREEKIVEDANREEAREIQEESKPNTPAGFLSVGGWWILGILVAIAVFVILIFF